jgi:predicted AAA+ superfamily ATPase
MEIVNLWPFSQGEIEGAVEGFIDAAFGDAPPVPGRRSASAPLTDRVLHGGYPEVLGIETASRRRAWFDAYVTSILQRDVRDLARIEGLTELPRLLALLAARPMAQLNYADLSRSVGLPQSTLKRYFALLEAVFLVKLLPPWHTNIGKRLVKTPKVLLTDSGLAAHLMGIDGARLAHDRGLLGGLLESFVAMELAKQAAWSEDHLAMYHFRTHEGDEVDLVLERRGGAVVGIEVKSAATVTAADFKGLRALAEAAGRRFCRGILLYTGTEVVPFGAGCSRCPWRRCGAGASRRQRRRRPSRDHLLRIVGRRRRPRLA